MTYQVLARKWRPQDFSGVVGQQPIVTALSNALSEGRVAQAYLFSGIRGVGKTSVARIFAKALNCEQGPTSQPCGECSSCSEIAASTNLLDVIEVDAATYSKVEQVRELTESLKYGPARDRYKVVILDEIHRLSRQAFDALLKIVEEPPSHLVFIFATTEIESVPATILSRCQEFRFRRVSFEELSQHLEKLATAEKIEVGPAALRLIARASDGSVRDAVALLDQLATFGSGKIDDDTAAGLLGGVEPKLFRDLLEAILEGKSSEVSRTIGEIETDGWDPRFVFTEFLHYSRSALHLALGADSDNLDLPKEESSALASLVERSKYEHLLRLLHLLLRSEETVRRSESGILAVEIAWLRAAELPKLVEIERLLAGQPAREEPATRPVRTPAPIEDKPPIEVTSPAESAPPDQPQLPAAPKTRAKAKPKTRAKAKPVPVRDPPPPENETAKKSPSPLPEPVEPPPAPATVEAFLGFISRRSQALAAHLAGAHRLEHIDGELKICTVVGDTWIRDRLAQEQHRQTLEAAVEATWGKGTAWRLIEEEAPPLDQAESQTEDQEAADDPTVQTLLDIFGGSVESVEDDE
jgi:DNA polymerase-3 subunit gamma/tau